MSRPVLVGPTTVTHEDGGCRVTAPVGDEALWFESSDAELDPGAEALAGTVVVAALGRGQPTRIAEPVSRVWLDNVARAQQLWHDWWGYPILPVQAEVLDHDRPLAAGRALLFTGGLDSFHSLLTLTSPPTTLVFVRGLAVSLGNEGLGAIYESMVRAVAAEFGAHAVVLRTNVRQHPVHRAGRLKHVVGGVLAAPGHLLAGAVATHVVSSSDSISQDLDPARFYGTHWDLDPLWSSERLTVESYGADRTRLEKLREIGDSELVRTHLRVCNGPSLRNCSKCDKCLLTMAMITTSGDPARWPQFDWSGSIAARLDRLNKTIYLASYPELLDEEGVTPALVSSARALLERTERRGQPASRMSRLGRRVRRTLRPSPEKQGRFGPP